MFGWFWFCFLKMDNFLDFSIFWLDCSKQLEVSLDGNILFDQLSLSTEPMSVVVLRAAQSNLRHENTVVN